MNEKIVMMFIHCLKEEHLLEHFLSKVKCNNIKDLISFILSHERIKQNPYQIISHAFTWDYSLSKNYCISHYKLCYFIKRILNIYLNNEVLENLVGREYTNSKNIELDNLARFFYEYQESD